MSHGKLPAAVLCLLGALSSQAAAPPDVIGQDLARLQVPGKVSAVLWTRREGYFTLQVMRQLSAEGRRIRNAAAGDAAALEKLWAEEAAQLQVWLLRADGSVIPPLARRDPAAGSSRTCARGVATRCLGDEILFRFPAAAGSEAVAVALRFGDVFLVEKLEKLPG